MLSLFIASYQLWLYRAAPEHNERLWAGLIAIFTGLYAFSIAIVYTWMTPAAAPWMMRFGFICLVGISHSMPFYAAAVMARELVARPWVVGVAWLWTGLILLTPWVVPPDVLPLHLAWLLDEVPQASPGPLAPVFFAWCLGVATLSVVAMWRHLPRTAASWGLLVAFSLWLLAAGFDSLVSLRLISGPVYLLEYGMVGFAVALFARTTSEHVALLHAAHASREASELSFRRVLDQSPDGVFLFRRNELNYVNDAAVQMMGYPSAEALLEVPPGEILHPEEQAHSRELLEHFLSGGPPPRAVECRMLRMDGGVCHAEASLALVDVGGKRMLVALVRNTSEQRELRAQVMELDRMVAIGTLAAGVAHEINNPLTYVAANVEVALDQLPADCDPELREMLSESLEGAGRIRRIVNDLRTAARKPDEEWIDEDLSEVLRVALRLADNLVRHQATVTLELEPLPPVRAPQGRLVQVFLNLLSNASASLDSRRQDHEISVRASVEGAFVVVRVRDTGVGIADSDLPRIFDAFFTTRGVGEGTGLGLSICRRIVQSCGGEIDVSSTVGAGSCFTVRLPVVEPSASQSG